jgi:hypothetical protein
VCFRFKLLSFAFVISFVYPSFGQRFRRRLITSRTLRMSDCSNCLRIFLIGNDHSNEPSDRISITIFPTTPSSGSCTSKELRQRSLLLRQFAQGLLAAPTPPLFLSSSRPTPCSFTLIPFPFSPSFFPSSFYYGGSCSMQAFGCAFIYPLLNSFCS